MAERIYLNFIWHMHQPFYWNAEENLFDFPWVRTHTTKDYCFMAKILKQFPAVKMTFNFSPSLIRQFTLYLEGKEDKVMQLAKKKAQDLTPEEKKSVLERFFLAPSVKQTENWPRFLELKNKAGEGVATFDTQDFLDLQIIYQLLWFDPLTIEENRRLKQLVVQGKNFEEQDKEVLWEATKQSFRTVEPLYRELMEKEQIEIATSPFYHPILPLLIDSKVGAQSNPGLTLPEENFSYPEDAVAQIRRALDFTREFWGKAVLGMWPSEGAVSEEALSIMVDQSLSWSASGEEVLYRSLAKEIQRDGEGLIQSPEILYSPYAFSGKTGKIGLFFRDRFLSDLIGFEYQYWDSKEAAQDLIEKIRKIKLSLPDEGQFVVTIILDGENAWEYYPNNGLYFLTELYQTIAESPDLVPITPSQLNEQISSFPELSQVVPGSWIFGLLDTWIGHPQKNQAWNSLARVRKEWEKEKERVASVSPGVVEQIWDLLYQAEGSDWFWWLGEDNPSSEKLAFQNHFSYLVQEVWKKMGKKEEIKVF